MYNSCQWSPGLEAGDWRGVGKRNDRGKQEIIGSHECVHHPHRGSSSIGMNVCQKSPHDSLGVYVV